MLLMFCVAKVFAVHFSIVMSSKRNSSRIVASNDDECVPVVCTPVKKGKSGESIGTPIWRNTNTITSNLSRIGSTPLPVLPVTPESRATYAAAMKELCESFSPEEEVNIFIIIVGNVVV